MLARGRLAPPAHPGLGNTALHASLAGESDMQVQPLPASFGAMLRFQSCRERAEFAGKTLRGLLAEHGLLVLRDLEMSAAEQVALLGQLGRIEPDATGAPMQMHVSNRRRTRPLSSRADPKASVRPRRAGLRRLARISCSLREAGKSLSGLPRNSV